MKLHYKPEPDSRYPHNLTARAAEWRYLSFAVANLRQEEPPHRDFTGENEVLIVPLTGFASIAYGTQTVTLGRKDLFTELTDILYLPPRTQFSITPRGPFEVTLGRAPAAGTKPARLIGNGAMKDFIRGGANVARGVTVLLDSDEISERLIAFEIRPPSGNWSSFPPHRHDARGNSSYHEETYYYRLKPTDGFVLQRNYSRDTALDVAIAVSDGDLVLVREGYHTVATAPGTNAYYLNFLAGEERKMRPVNDPHYDWISKDWDGNPMKIPIRG